MIVNSIMIVMGVVSIPELMCIIDCVCACIGGREYGMPDL